MADQVAVDARQDVTHGSASLEVAFHRPPDRNDELSTRDPGVRFLDLPARRFVMIDGEGAPGEEAFAPRMPGLYATAYTLRFALKRRGVIEKVGPLEGLWWTAAVGRDLDAILGELREDWRWVLLIALPDAATDDEIATALHAGRSRLVTPHNASLRVEPFAEGRVAQAVHIGPYETERTTIEQMHAAIASAGLVPTGRHHEIYLGDPRRTRPERIRTILRQPVEEADGSAG